MKALFHIVIGLLGTVICANAQSICPGQFADRRVVADCATAQVKAFNLSDVRLLPSRFTDNMRRDSAWMASIAVDRLLHSFRTTAGVFASREGGYMTVNKLGGWESLDCDLRGHTTGHYLSACALMYGSTGNPLFKLKGDSIVAALADVQRAHGDGYLSAFPREFISRNIEGKTVWAPWYTIHKILSGLIDQYLYCGNEQALRVACGMADWSARRLLPLDDATRRRMLRNEFGGVNEAFYNLYSLTGTPDYLRLARFFYHDDVIDPLHHRDADFGTKHTNTFIPKTIAEMRNYELTADTAALSAARFFFDRILADHTFASGSCSDKEHFFNPAHMADHLSGYTGETCCSYNMLKLARHLFCAEPDSRIADYYEQVLYNHILGQQDPATGMVCYFMPMLTGAYKVYSTPFNSFWCCVGSGFENHAKYAESIYFHSDNDLYVNLFIPSEVTWRDKGLTLTQTTAFPAEESTRLAIAVNSPVKATLRLRCPAWAGSGLKVAVNGRKVKTRVGADGYLALERTWRDGDCVDLTLPMSLRLEGVAGSDERAAVLYGPILLAGELGTEGMASPAPHSDPALYNDYYTYDYRIPQSLSSVNLTLPNGSIHGALTRIPGQLAFSTADGLRLSPLFNIHRQRYVVYWNLAQR